MECEFSNFTQPFLPELRFDVCEKDVFGGPIKYLPKNKVSKGAVKIRG